MLVAGFIEFTYFLSSTASIEVPATSLHHHQFSITGKKLRKDEIKERMLNDDNIDANIQFPAAEKSSRISRHESSFAMEKFT